MSHRKDLCLECVSSAWAEPTRARRSTTVASSFHTLTYWPNRNRQPKICDVKRSYSAWMFQRFDSCQVLQQSQVISIYQARTRNGFRKNQGDELLNIQFISCHPSWHLHLSSRTGKNQRRVVPLLKIPRRNPYPLKVNRTVKDVSNGLWKITVAARVSILIGTQL